MDRKDRGDLCKGFVKPEAAIFVYCYFSSGRVINILELAIRKEKNLGFFKTIFSLGLQFLHLDLRTQDRDFLGTVRSWVPLPVRSCVRP